MDTGEEYFLRLMIFITEGCPKPLRSLFLQKAQTDPRNSSPFTTLKSYLTIHHSLIQSLLQKGIIRKDQVELIFPLHGNSPVDIENWDTALMCTLLKHLFYSTQHQIQCENNDVDKIRQARNELHHLPGYRQISENYFKRMWMKLETASKNIARCVNDPQVYQDMETYISCLMSRPLPCPIFDVIKQWLTDDIIAIRNNTETAKRILEDTVITSNKRSGLSEKRMKTVDYVMINMQDQFTWRLTRRSSGEFTPSSKFITDIQSKLREHHKVVVSGFDASKLVETTLTAIKELGYDCNNKRCIEINQATEWNHVCTDHVDFVLFMYPFGKDHYNRKQAAAVSGKFDRIMAFTQAEKRDDIIDVVFVTQHAILQEFLQEHNHDVLTHKVVITEPTTVVEPCDLSEKDRILKDDRLDGICVNFRGHTQIYMQHLKCDFYDRRLFCKAKQMLKLNKYILISGPRGSGKSSLAVSLMSSYQPQQCLVLMFPLQWSFVRLEEISLLLIEDFAGKYRYDVTNSADWYTVFDMMYGAVEEGKLSVIITCEEAQLSRCLAELSPHKLLKNKLDLPEITIPRKIIKEELDTYHQPKQRQYNAAYFGDFSVKLSQDDGVYSIRGLCMAPDGSVLLTDHNNKEIKRLDTSYKVIDTCRLESEPWGMCCINANEVAVCQYNSSIQFVSIADSLTLTRSIPLQNHFGFDLHFINGRIAVAGGYTDNNIHEYSIAGERLNTVILPSTGTIFSRRIAGNNSGTRLYVCDKQNGLICFDEKWNELWRYKDEDLVDAKGVCVDEHDNLFVCDFGSNKVLQVHPSGQKIGVLLQEADGLNKPRSICYNRGRKHLIIGMDGCDCVKVFSLA